MKKRSFALLLAALMVAALFGGCGASSEAYDNGMMKEEAAVEAPAAGEFYGTTADSNSMKAETGSQKLIRRVNMEAETEDLQAVLSQVTAKVTELGGYIESQQLSNGSAYASYRRQSVNMTIRIPADRLAEFTSQVEGISNVVNYSESAEDVTLQYVDTESRVRALEVEQERLLALLEKAENLKDLLEIEGRLTDVRYELERYASQLRALDNKIDYATVSLYINQVKVYTEVEPQTAWQRIGSGFKKNLRNIGENLTDFFVWTVTYSPQLLFWAAAITALVVLVKRKFRKIPVKKAKMPKQEETEN